MANAIERFIELQTKEVQKNVTVVKASDLGQNYMLHIDKNMPSRFTPRVPKTGPEDANSSVARITVSPSLLACYIGYGRGEDDFWYCDKDTIDSDDPYRGGYEICKLEFEYCLKPTVALIDEARRSNEYWLVGYTPETVVYKPKKVGIVFVSEIAYTAISGKSPSAALTMLVQVTDAEGFDFLPDRHLEKGYYQIELQWDDLKKRSCANYRDLEISSISEEEFTSKKRAKADLLHRDQAPFAPIPNFMNW